MYPTPTEQLVYLSAQGQGVVTCPQCTEQSKVSASDYRDLHKPLTVMGNCGHRFPALFNTRYFYRKPVCLSGTYTSPGETTRRQMTVVNLSLTGVQLRTLLSHTFHVNDVVELAFCLDDSQHTEMRHQVIIRWANDKQVGAEFCDLQTYERELGFYLRPA